MIPFQYDLQHRGLHCGLYLDPTMTAFWSLGCGLIGTLHRFLCTRYSGGHTSVHVLRDVGCACWSSALLWGLRPAMVRYSGPTLCSAAIEPRRPTRQIGLLPPHSALYVLRIKAEVWHQLAHLHCTVHNAVHSALLCTASPGPRCLLACGER